MSTDGNDIAAIEAAIDAARADERPSLIAVRTHIGYGSPNKQDTQKAHGSPLGEEEVRLDKEVTAGTRIMFYIPDDALRVFRAAVPAGEELSRTGRPAWTRMRPIAKTGDGGLGLGGQLHVVTPEAQGEVFRCELVVERG